MQRGIVLASSPAQHCSRWPFIRHLQAAWLLHCWAAAEACPASALLTLWTLRGLHQPSVP